MVLKMYGMRGSTCTRRVTVVLKEKEVPYEFIPVDVFGGAHKTPEHLKKQPFGQVPYIDDDGFILFESRAIARYIDAKYGTSLIPTDLKANAKFEEAASIEAANFDPPASAFASEKVFKKKFGKETDEARAKEYLETLSKKLDAYEVILSKQKYIAGDKLTLADLFHLSYGSMVESVSPETFSSRPHVARWLAELQARPAWIAACAKDEM